MFGFILHKEDPFKRRKVNIKVRVIGLPKFIRVSTHSNGDL